MTTPAFTHIDTTKPTVAGTRQTGIDATRNNFAALVWYITMGHAPGWSMANSANVEEPAWRMWTNGSDRLAVYYTYTAGYVTAIQYDWSNDGATWVQIHTETLTYNTGNNYTAGTNASALSQIWEWVGKFKDLRTLFTAHNGGAVGTYHTGIGTMAAQAASAVAVTGGSIKGTTVGGTGAGEAVNGKFTAANEKYAGDVTIGGSTYTLDMSLGTWFRISPTGNYNIAVSNAPASGWINVILLEVVDGAGHSLTMTGGSWGALGAPTFSANTDFVQLISRDAFSTTRIIMGSKG